MPKKIDARVKERCVRQVLEHLQEYPSLTAAAEAVARREGVGKESVRRWVIQAQIDGGQRQGATTEELAEIRELKAKVRRLEQDNQILRQGGCRTDLVVLGRRFGRPTCRGAQRARSACRRPALVSGDCRQAPELEEVVGGGDELPLAVGGHEPSASETAEAPGCA